MTNGMYNHILATAIILFSGKKGVKPSKRKTKHKYANKHFTIKNKQVMKNKLWEPEDKTIDDSVGRWEGFGDDI